ncbi:MAG: YsnF/AvaK domain-containing protein [Candidatus Dormibacteraeota bacterium]|nr:YsnF/AvaK domain-containing protein [Candidatus Dormibacteraeota bacterium]
MAGITALFADAATAQRAVEELHLMGISQSHVRVNEQRHGILESLLPQTDRPGYTRVSVNAPGRNLEASAVLYRHGGIDEEGDAGANRAPQDPGGLAVELVGEELRPEVGAVQVGELVVTKKVITEVKTIEVEVRREEVTAEHVAVTPHAPDANPNEIPVTQDGRSSAQPAPPQPRAFGDGEAERRLSAEDEVIRIPVYEERVVVHRVPVVVVELVIHKRRVPETRQLSDTVRHEEPVMESTGDVTLVDGGTVPA